MEDTWSQDGRHICELSDPWEVPLSRLASLANLGFAPFPNKEAACLYINYNVRPKSLQEATGLFVNLDTCPKLKTNLDIFKSDILNKYWQPPLSVLVNVTCCLIWKQNLLGMPNWTRPGYSYGLVQFWQSSEYIP